jgi:hypothetical protein
LRYYWEGIIGRRKRKAFNRFLERPDLHIRGCAENLAARDIEARALLRYPQHYDYCELDDNQRKFEGEEAGEGPEDSCSQNETNELGNDDIPF